MVAYSKRVVAVSASLAAALALSACASDHIVVAHGSVWGVGAEGKPDGTAAAAIGAVIGDAAAVPYVNKKTGQQYTVPNSCGGYDAVSVQASVSGKGTSGTVASGVTLGIDHDLSVGAPAVLAALTGLQAAAGQNHNVVSDYLSCGGKGPIVSAATQAAAK